MQTIGAPALDLLPAGSLVETEGEICSRGCSNSIIPHYYSSTERPIHTFSIALVEAREGKAVALASLQDSPARKIRITRTGNPQCRLVLPYPILHSSHVIRLSAQVRSNEKPYSSYYYTLQHHRIDPPPPCRCACACLPVPIPGISHCIPRLLSRPWLS